MHLNISVDIINKNVYNIISSREQTTAKGENEVIVRCTGDTNIIPGKGKQRNKSCRDWFKTCRS